MPTTSTDPDHANEEIYDRYYEKPAWWFRWRYDTQVKRKTVLALTRLAGRSWDGATIFELGFGSAETLFSFSRSCRVIGAEISTSAVRVARTKAGERGFRQAEFHEIGPDARIPVADATADLVIASHVLEHVRELEPCLAELRRVLRPGGFMAVLVPINERRVDPKHARSFTAQSCVAACENAGFERVAAFENELGFYLVDSLYARYGLGHWPPAAQVARIAFNLATAWWPFAAYRLLDRLIGSVTKLPPRQAAILLRRT